MRSRLLAHLSAFEESKRRGRRTVFAGRRLSSASARNNHQSDDTNRNGWDAPRDQRFHGVHGQLVKLWGRESVRDRVESTGGERFWRENQKGCHRERLQQHVVVVIAIDVRRRRRRRGNDQIPLVHIVFTLHSGDDVSISAFLDFGRNLSGAGDERRRSRQRRRARGDRERTHFRGAAFLFKVCVCVFVFANIYIHTRLKKCGRY